MVVVMVNVRSVIMAMGQGGMTVQMRVRLFELEPVSMRVGVMFIM